MIKITTEHVDEVPMTPIEPVDPPEEDGEELVNKNDYIIDLEEVDF